MRETPAGSGSGSRAPSSAARFALYTILTVLLVAALVGLDVLVLARGNPNARLSGHSYLALGNSLAFGYQPNFNFTDGFADQLYQDLRKADVGELVNYGCVQESTTTMIEGNCPGRFAHHGSYTGSQLNAAEAYLRRNLGKVSPVTLEIGANDVISDWNASTCTAGPSADDDLARMDRNLTETILPRLTSAMTDAKGNRTGVLVMLNYYNPFAQVCPDSGKFLKKLNAHLAQDAAKFRVPVVDIYTAFGGDERMAENVCVYTWMCDPQFRDIHPKTAGYAVIAQAIEHALGFPGPRPAPNPLLGNAFLAGAIWRQTVP